MNAYHPIPPEANGQNGREDEIVKAALDAFGLYGLRARLVNQLTSHRPANWKKASLDQTGDI